MKRNIIAFVLLLAVLLTITACGTTPEVPETQAPVQVPDSTKAPEPGVEAPETPEPAVNPLPLVDEPATLTVWCPIKASAFDHIESWNENAAFIELGKRTNVVLDFTNFSSSALNTQFPIMIASGEYCDFLANMTRYTGGLSKAIEEEVIIDVYDLVIEHAPHYKEKALDADYARRCLVTAEGYLPGFSFMSDENSMNSKFEGLIVRADWLEDLGMSYEDIVTYDDFHDMLVNFKTEFGATSPLFVNAMGIGTSNSLSAGYGITGSLNKMTMQYGFMINDEGKVDYTYLREECQQFLKMMNQWYNEGLLWADFMTCDNEMIAQSAAAKSEFLDGKMGVAYGQASDIATLPEFASEEGYKLAGLAEPVLKEGDMVGGKGGPSTPTVSWAISTSCKDPVLAVRLMDYLYTDEGTLLMNFGVEDLSYTMVDGAPRFTELVTNNPEGLTFDTCCNIYCVSSVPMIQLYERKTAIYSDSEDAIQATVTWGSNLSGENFYPNISLSAEESEIYAPLSGDINTFVSEQVPAFIRGDLSLETDWDKFIETLEDMKIYDCIEVKQQAYDRYIAK